MSFEKGSISLRLFKCKPGSTIPDDSIARFAKDAIPAIDAIPVDGCAGWATARHMLDRNITDESAIIAGKIRLTLVKAEKKIPAALFKAECKQEELAVMAAKGVPFLKRAEKTEIAKGIRERMLPQMPPSLAGIDVVKTSDGCYSTAVSDSQVDMFCSFWRQSTGQDLFAYTPVAAAMLLGGVDIRSLSPTSFSADVDDADLEQDIGTEFLTWLWYYSEACGGMVKTADDGDYAYAVEGPFTFVHEGLGAHEIVVRKGNPGIAKEAKSALQAGKKLKKAKLTIAKGDESWSCSINGSEWTFGSLKMPVGEKLGAIESFEERMILLGRFVVAIEAAFKKFIAIRKEPATWETEVLAVRQWISDKACRA